MSKEFSLPQEHIEVEFIKRKKGMAANVEDNHVISGGMLENAVKRFCAPVQRNGSIANILTDVEKEFLEKETGLNLSVYGDFWNTYMVSLRKNKDNNKFFLGNPMDYISYKILLANSSEIAPNWNARKKKNTYQFVIVRSEEKIDERKTKLDVKKEAFKLYGKIENDRDKLLSILKLHSNRPISSDSKLKWLQGEVEDIVDNSPSKFLSIANDVQFLVKALIYNAVDTGVIKIQDNQYYTVDGLKLAKGKKPASFDNAVEYLSDVKNSEVKDLIEAKVNNAR